ncbi:MAG: asparagine synthase (glutamine-hydrolyzing) [Deltaproteobacteria bacterium]|nr:asparagine synthase (glutamine-hydrolyzing) [Deltaproteobacteria bacterium]
MCGIAGIVDYARPSASHRSRALAMRSRLRHRGPDGEGDHVGPDVTLVHTRLAVLDVAGGAQPMSNGRYVIVYNGELANAAELRAELADYPFRTRSDTEVVLAAFTRWGDACASRLSGMFAFFVWDVERRRGFAARDRLGVKPFFHARERSAGGDVFVFASEAQAIAHTTGAVVRANTSAIVDVMVAPCFSGVDQTMFAGVEPLLPGHALVVDRDGVHVSRWWRWPTDRARALLTEPSVAVARLAAEVPAAVSRALASDVAVGVFASGGLDSTILSAVLARETPGARAYTVTFDDQARFDYAASAIIGSDDTPFAHLAARELGLEERRVHVARAEIARDLERVAIANDALPAWEQEIAQHRLADAARRDGTKVVLVGDAADETHYGYHFLLDPGALAGPHVIMQRLGSVPIRRELSERPREEAVRRLVRHVEEAGASFDSARDLGDRIVAMTLLVVERWLPRLLHNGDAHTMRASVEARVPFADVRLVELAASIAPEIAHREGVEKWALRESARGLIPERIRARKKSALPKDLAVERVYRAELARVLEDPPPLVRAVVDLEAMRAMTKETRALSEAERAAAFRVVTLAHWARHHGVEIS